MYVITRNLLVLADWVISSLSVFLYLKLLDNRLNCATIEL